MSIDPKVQKWYGQALNYAQAMRGRDLTAEEVTRLTLLDAAGFSDGAGLEGMAHSLAAVLNAAVDGVVAITDGAVTPEQVYDELRTNLTGAEPPSDLA